ncbi:hypothetical protein BH23PAT2_BH23PAT2_09560 [soil metagenome]
MSSHVDIRPAIQKDVEEIEKLVSKFGSVKEEGFEARIRRILDSDDHHIFVAEVSSQLVGYAWVQSHGQHLRSGDTTARFNDLFVLPEFRGRKIGTLLFEAVKDWAKKSQVIYLQWQASSKAIKFYEKLGLKGDTTSDLEEHPFYELKF